MSRSSSLKRSSSSSSPFLPDSSCASPIPLLATATTSSSPILFVDLMPTSTVSPTSHISYAIGVAVLTVLRTAIAPIVVCTVKDALDLLRRETAFAAALVRAESTALATNRNVSAVLHSASMRHLPTALVTYGDDAPASPDDADVCIHRRDGGAGIDWSIVTAIFKTTETQTLTCIGEFAVVITLPSENRTAVDWSRSYCRLTQSELVLQQTAPACAVGECVIRLTKPRPFVDPSQVACVVSKGRIQWNANCKNVVMSQIRSMKFVSSAEQRNNDRWMNLMKLMREWNESLRVEYAGDEYLLSPSQTALTDAVISIARTVDDVIDTRHSVHRKQSPSACAPIQYLRGIIAFPYNPMEYSTVTNAKVIADVCWNYAKSMISASLPLSTLTKCCIECGRTPLCIESFCSAECVDLSHSKLTHIGNPDQMTDFELYNTRPLLCGTDDRFVVIGEELLRWGNRLYVDSTNSLDINGVGLRARSFIPAESILLPLHGVVVMNGTTTPQYRSRLLYDINVRNRCLDADILNEGEYEFGIALNEYCAGVCINSTFGMKEHKRNVRFALHPHMIFPKHNAMWKTIPSGLYVVIADRDIQVDEEILNDYKFTDKH